MAFSKVSSAAAVLALACVISNAAVTVTAYAVQETVDYVGSADDVALQGYIVYPSSMADIEDSTEDLAFLDYPNTLHTVVIVPDWDNINEYELTRAQMIADELGYAAFVADLYGADLHDVQDMDTKVEQATKYRSNPDLFNARIRDAIVAGVAANSLIGGSGKVAIIGYCLGGTGVLSYSFANTLVEEEDEENTAINKNAGAYPFVVGAVSFHGGLMDFEVTGEMASPVLVLSGGADDAGTAVEALEASLKSANATWQITRYSDIQHGFTNFVNDDRYNEWADERSWSEMKSFLQERFGETSYGTPQPEQGIHYVLAEDVDVGVDVSVSRMSDGDSDTERDMGMITVTTVDYEDDEGFALQGYLAVPPMEEGTTMKQLPAILIVPDWDGTSGPTGYEAGRAVLGALDGYIVMVADVYGSNYTDVADMLTHIELSTKYRSDPDLFVKRIQTGVDQLLAHPAVDTSMIFVTGYCLGGTGAIDYAFSTANALDNVKAVVPIHGGLTPLRAVQTTDSVTPYVMILSGGVDDAHGNTTELELHLDAANATWEISRYSNAQHGFTGWSSPAYQPMADSRSWMSTMSLFETMVGAGGGSSEEMEVGSAEMHSDGEAEDLSHDEDEDHSHDEDEDTDMGEDHSHDESEMSEKDMGIDHSDHSHNEIEMSESELSSADRRSAFGVVAMAAALFAALVAV